MLVMKADEKVLAEAVLCLCAACDDLEKLNRTMLEALRPVMGETAASEALGRLEVCRTQFEQARKAVLSGVAVSEKASGDTIGLATSDKSNGPYVCGVSRD